MPHRWGHCAAENTPRSPRESHNGPPANRGRPRLNCGRQPTCQHHWGQIKQWQPDRLHDEVVPHLGKWKCRYRLRSSVHSELAGLDLTRRLLFLTLNPARPTIHPSAVPSPSPHPIAPSRATKAWKQLRYSHTIDRTPPALTEKNINPTTLAFAAALRNHITYPAQPSQNICNNLTYFTPTTRPSKATNQS